MSIVVASTKLRQARVTLYDVDPNDVVESAGIRVTYSENFLKGVSSPSLALHGDLGLQVLSVQRAAGAYSTRTMTSQRQSQMRSRTPMVITSFRLKQVRRTTRTSTTRFEIRVDKPGMTARTRTGYYASPELIFPFLLPYPCL